MGASLDVSAPITDPGTTTARLRHCVGRRDDHDRHVDAGTCTGSHAFASALDYTSTVTATDDDGGSGSDTVTITVRDVPPPPPTVSIDDQSHPEGDGATTPFTFTVSLDHAGADPVTIHWATHDGSATVADNDYLAASGDPRSSAVRSSRTVTVSVNGDTKIELDEDFTVELSAPINATIGDGQGSGIITNDDVNHPPVLAPSRTCSCRSVSLGRPFSATDADLDTLTFGSARLPAFAVRHDNGDGTGDLRSRRQPPTQACTRTSRSPCPMAPRPIPDLHDRRQRRAEPPSLCRRRSRGDARDRRRHDPVLRNDTDIDDDPLTIISFDDRGGRVHCGPDCRYTPSANVTYTDEFTYTVGDGHGAPRGPLSSSGLRERSDRPPRTTRPRARCSSQSIEVLFNDRDPEGDKLTAVLSPRSRATARSPVGTRAATRRRRLHRPDSFDYQVDDGHGGCEGERHGHGRG